MQVIKRDGKKEELSFDKITTRLKILGNDKEPKLKLNYSKLVMSVIEQIYPNIQTTIIDELTATHCSGLASKHPDYGLLATRVLISNIHKNTAESFHGVMKSAYEFKDNNNNNSPLISEEIWNIINANKDFFDDIINFDHDYNLDYFGIKTLERAYLLRLGDQIIERPQHMWLRVAIGIHKNNLDLVKETYLMMANKYFTHATPTLFNAGSPRPQLSSCYLLSMEDDSIEGIFNTLKDCAQISKWAGGIGLHIHNVRATGSHIRGTNGISNGIVPMLQVFNMTARYVDQGGGKRNGSFAIYLEPWHPDILDFLELRKNHGDELSRARDLFYALWTPNLFMKKVKLDEQWHLFCPNNCPGLSDAYGEEFENIYNKYVSEGKYIKTIKARELWFKILDSQMETGTPYILYKDSANIKSNQKNIGTIKSSNLCCEIIQYSDPHESAVCNLASISLSRFVIENENKELYFNFDELYNVTQVVTNNLNNIIDINYYPTPKTEVSNKKHRPIGIGVQGLADCFALLDLPFCCKEAKELNKNIFETMYYAALEKSMLLAKSSKEPYSTFNGSPASKGILQFDMWGVQPSQRYDWNELKENIKLHGLKNSLLIAPMPTASTSQILGNNECFEPFTSNIYTRRTLAGEFIVANKYLMKDLLKLNLWNDKLRENIIANKGSIQHIEGIPKNIKDKYKIVWELPMKEIIDMAADRGAYICQSQSMNLWMEDPDYKSLTSMHFYSWEKGLKTGIYYLRRKPKHQPQQFTIEPENTQYTEFEDNEVCEMCSA